MKNTKVRILQTSDLHGYIYPKSYATKDNENIGLAKVATLINENRTEKSIVIDTGDTIQGSPLIYYFSKHGQGKNPLVDIMNYINYDFVTIGNHEFNYGLEYLGNYLNYLDAKIINSNIIKNGKPLFGNPYEIIEIDGIKIAIIGVTTHYIPNWEQPSTIKNIDFVDAFEACKNTVNEVKDTVDFVIVSYHGGFERDLESNELVVEDTGENQGSRMLNEIEGIDLLLTGHQHRSEQGIKNNTIYVQPGFNGQSVSLIDLEFNDKELVNYETNLLSTENYNADEHVLDLAKDVEEKTNIFLDTPVGSTTFDLLIKDQLDARLNKHPLVTLFNQIQLDYTGADISSISLGNNVSGFNKKISIRDVISTYIYPNTLVVKNVLGSDLLKGLEKTAEFFMVKDGKIDIHEKYKTPKVQLYNYDMYDGIDYTIDLTKEFGSRVTECLFKGKPLEKDKLYKVAMNNYRAAGGGDYTFFKNSETYKDTQTEILEILIDYIVREKDLVIDHKNNIKIVY